MGKNPEDYPDAKSQPHVQVALRLKAKGGSARVGDVIPYIFCVGDESEKGVQAERAKHPDELKRAASNEFSIDYEYYLAHQVLPPIERLCDPIQGTDRARLAECLGELVCHFGTRLTDSDEGLDPNRYKSSAGFEGRSAITTLDSQVSDAERFRNSEPFIVRCRGCQGEVSFSPIWEREVSGIYQIWLGYLTKYICTCIQSSILQPSGPICPACNHSFGQASLQTQLEVQIRACIARYYQGWTICDDATCGNRTRSMNVYGRRCVRSGCRGTIRFEYSDVELYNQLRYFAMLFDSEKVRKAAIGSASFGMCCLLMSTRFVSWMLLDEVCTLANINATFLTEMSATVNKYVNQCGRRWVDLGALFSDMMRL